VQPTEPGWYVPWCCCHGRHHRLCTRACVWWGGKDSEPTTRPATCHQSPQPYQLANEVRALGGLGGRIVHWHVGGTGETQFRLPVAGGCQRSPGQVLMLHRAAHTLCASHAEVVGRVIVVLVWVGGASTPQCVWVVCACVWTGSPLPPPPPNTRVGLWPSAVCVRMVAPLTAQACPRSEMHASHVIQKVRRGGVPTSTCTEGATAAWPALGWRASTPKWAVSNCFGRRKTGGGRALNFVWDPPPSSCSNTAKLLN
jgi:hypothetical protein